MNYQETITYLYNSAPLFQNVGQGAYKEGLSTTHTLDDYFGHPHRKFRTIHVGGTNGKGSCSHTLAAILQSAGYKVGLYTSPHLVDFRERIRVNGEMIPEERVVRFVEEEREFFEPLHPSFFELATALAFKYFEEAGVDIAVSTYAALADHPMIAAVKEASGNISKLVETVALCGDKLDIYSGNDDQIVPIMACGGKGVISVLSNVVPKETVALCKKFFDGDVAGAMELQKQYLALTNALFSEVNPIPVKAAMAALGFCEDYLRLPLVPMSDGKRAHLLACMREVGLDF